MTPTRPVEPRYLACVTADTPHYFADDVHTTCAVCGAPIFHRPHALTDMPGIVPICLPCALHLTERKKAEGNEVHLAVTTRTLAEVRQAADKKTRKEG